MSVRIYNKANREYIEKLLDEMEQDRDFCFEIEVNENRQNGIIGNLIITARQVEECNFQEAKDE